MGWARERDMKDEEVPLAVLATQHEKSQEATELNQCNRNNKNQRQGCRKHPNGCDTSVTSSQHRG